jgi:hypothetical protein
MSDDLVKRSDAFRLRSRPTDEQVDEANWMIDRMSSRIEELEAQNELLQQMIASLPPPHPDNTLRNRLAQRRARTDKPTTGSTTGGRGNLPSPHVLLAAMLIALAVTLLSPLFAA